MAAMVRVAHLRGIAGGAAILTSFGAAWCFLALANWTAAQPGRPSWSLPAASIATVALLALCAARLLSLRKLHDVPDPIAAAKGKRDGMFFGIIFGAEGGLIGLSSFLLARYGLSDWIVIATAIIVGAHFLPLASLFHLPLYYWTGALSILGALACTPIPDPAIRTRSAAFVMTAVLWITAVLLLQHAASLQAART
jgi:hypothetical protein